MGSAAFKSVASARSLVGVMVGVVLAFLAATAASQFVESTSSRQLDEIIGNAMPSVQQLIVVRGDLRRIGRELRESRDPEAMHEIAETRRNIDAALAAYTALPFFPGELAMYSGVPELLRRFDTELAAKTFDLARDTLDVVDRRLERIVAFDASQGQRLGLAIARARTKSRVVVWMFDSGSVLLAIGAMVLAMRQRRRAIRVLVEEEKTARERMVELASQVDELGHFAGRVAHDIRGPLQTAMVSLEIVRERGAGFATIGPSAQRGVAALARMSTLVDGLLEFARAGGKPADGVVANVGDVIRDVVDGVAAEAASHQIELRVESSEGARVQCSTGVLTSIVSNLVRNAMRHMGDAAERRVDVSVREAGARWCIEVVDTGPGIPPGKEQAIFEPYVQLDGSKGGVGLGLATVDRLVRAHGGAVGVSSPPGHGCRFWFELPRAA